MMQFEFITTTINDSFLKVNIRESNIWVSFDEVFGLLENNSDFKKQLVDFLSSIEFSAYNIECKPVNIENVNQAFEIVIVPCQELLTKTPDASAFKEHFNDEELTAIFENLSGDAVLISPRPSAQSLNFGHLKAFIENANKEQINDLLTALGEIAAANLGNDDIYINTSGLGVPWLHLRIDDAPKYYQFKAYRNN
ncbi:MAG: hypothetical protein JXQ87_13675 [Bacteroidia bacterium]